MNTLTRKKANTNGSIEKLSIDNKRDDIHDLIHSFATCEENELRSVTIKIQQKLETIGDADEVFDALKHLHDLRSKYGFNRYEVEWFQLDKIIQDYLVVLINRESREAERITKGFINLLEKFHEIRRLDSSFVLEAIEKKIEEIRLVSLD